MISALILLLKKCYIIDYWKNINNNNSYKNSNSNSNSNNDGDHKNDSYPKIIYT